MMTVKQSFISFLQSEEIPGITNFRQVDQSLTLFTYQGINFLFAYEDTDSTVFHLIVPKIEAYNVELDEKMLDFTKRYKIAKAIRVDDFIWLSFEQLVFNQKEGDYRMFKIGIKILSSMLREWKGASHVEQFNKTR